MGSTQVHGLGVKSCPAPRPPGVDVSNDRSQRTMTPFPGVVLTGRDGTGRIDLRRPELVTG